MGRHRGRSDASDGARREDMRLSIWPGPEHRHPAVRAALEGRPVALWLLGIARSVHERVLPGCTGDGLLGTGLDDGHVGGDEPWDVGVLAQVQDLILGLFE